MKDRQTDRLYNWYLCEKWCSTHHLGYVAYLIRGIIRILFSCDIPFQVEIGEGTKFPHDGLGMIMHHETKIGKNCIILHGCTFGGRGNKKGAPNIGDNCLIGAHSIIIGPVKIGNNSIVGAGSVVINDVPDNSVVAGNPAKFIKFNKIC